MELAKQKAYTIKDLRQFGSDRKWRRLIAAGEIGVIRVGGKLFVPEEELDRFLKERFRPATQAPTSDDKADPARPKGRPQ